ncbi:hypothetical protein [Aliirhizobium smilacinae]|uniref:DUF2591 domain-containing protein n=1 Tax=Aliirhizobium smilacinae TaxID=1395944 RepID=A0A5C4XST9_9HYPH|nr:hypothetical protein [Rhizobium smilacinae]TNM66161.1 hypothetical protein FHP24_08105 [Rhizobium smilacinae]
MQVVELLKMLITLETGYRRLDGEIAKILGWREVAEKLTEDGETKTRYVWLHPENGQPGKVPFYTTNLDAAIQFAEAACPNERCGFSWEDGKASARLGNGPYFQAKNPILALSAAALHRVVTTTARVPE